MAKPDLVGHLPVLCAPAVAALLHDAAPGAIFVDATFGGGGHSRAILQQLPGGGRLLAMDCDEVAARTAAEVDDARFCFRRQNFGDLKNALAAEEIRAVDGVLFDLGVSSNQLDDAARGFSFRREGALDMRLDRRNLLTARQWLMDSDEKEIARALRQFGEEPAAKIIARALSRRRREMQTTLDVAKLVGEIKGIGRHRHSAKHPATRVFQAIRIAVNRELEMLQKGLLAACESLRGGGRLVVIAFHSLEDRIAKRIAAGLSFPGFGRLDICGMRQVGKLIRPDDDEIAANPRCRSARMRVFIKNEAGQ